jgi:hypothetical protein
MRNLRTYRMHRKNINITPEARSEIVQVATLHGKVIARRDENLEQFDLIMPPCLLESTAAEELGDNFKGDGAFI